MRKILIFVLIFTFSLVAREEVFAAKECPAFNNMKHTKNSHNIILDTSKKYTILRRHKGQALILIKGEQPAQRWVDDGCFPKIDQDKETSVSEVSQSISMMLQNNTKKPIDAIYTEKYEKTNTQKISQNNLLALSWHNAFCETHRFKKECKRPKYPISAKEYKEKYFILHGLWPQPKNKNYCDVDSRVLRLDKHKQWHKLPDLDLDEDIKKELSVIMPGYASNLHKHQWVKHGSCYGTDANRYFEDSIGLVKQVNDSKVGKFFSKNIGKRVTLQQVRTIFNRSFGVGTGSRVELRCKNGLITELWLHLGEVRSGIGAADIANLLKKGSVTRSRCQSGLIDKAGF